jgi:serine-type D-Ala-D-Ala carboxypeptidase/endopeptidase (penicillin-binding protein 4)
VILGAARLRGKGRPAHLPPAPDPPAGASVTIAWVRRGLVVVVVALAVASQAAASRPPLPTRLANALAVRGNAPATSAALAVDLRTGGIVFERNADLSLDPASNEKLPVTFAALRELGSTYRFRTAVLASGRRDGAVWRGNLYLKGYGDPTLTSARLARLATQIAASGITRVEGRLVADETWFDRRRVAPGWKSGFLVYECPPLSALVVDRGFYDHHTALDPATAAAGAFRRILRGLGVTTGAVGLGRAPGEATQLGEVVSPTLANVVAVMDRDSDNFRAEMLLKELGAQVGGGGTTAAGTAVVRRALATADIPLDGVVLADGSGLSSLDRLTASTVVRLLVTAWNDPELRRVFWSSLPVAGENGTLVHRMEDGPAHGAVRAKTGTTDHASALSGYAGDRYAFAVLQNGDPVAWTPARKAQDRFATALASAAGE